MASALAIRSPPKFPLGQEKGPDPLQPQIPFAIAPQKVHHYLNNAEEAELRIDVR